MYTSRFAVSVTLLAIFAIVLASRDIHAQNAVQPVERLTVVDANGKRVGTVFGFIDEFPIVSFRVDKRLVILRVGWNQFMGQGGLTVERRQFYFESGNCTGTPFTTGSFGQYVAPTHLLDVYRVLAQEGPSKAIVVRSQGSTSDTTCEPVNPTAIPAAMPWRLLIDLNQHFQAPFTLQ